MMRAVLEDGEEPSYADPQARAFLADARSTYRLLRLDKRSVVDAGGHAYLMTWAGRQSQFWLDYAPAFDRDGSMRRVATISDQTDRRRSAINWLT